MPRPPRLLLSHSCYHVMTRGNNRHNVFKDDEDFVYYLSLIERFKADHPFDLFHYCLMNNHVHMLVKTNKAGEFSTFMKRLNLAYFHHYRNRYGWSGHFWQDRFKSQPVGKDNYFIQCGKYIELNPVRANITKDPARYIYSSYNYYVQGAEDRLLTKNMFYDELGTDEAERRTKYRAMVVDDVISSNYARNIWGSSQQRYREQDKINRKRKKV